MSIGLIEKEATSSLRQWLDRVKLKPGARLPSERALAKTLGLKHTTTHRAVAHLIAEGTLVRDGYKLFVPAPSTRTAPTETLYIDLVINASPLLIRRAQKIARELSLGLRIHRWDSNEEVIDILQGLDPSDMTGILFQPSILAVPSAWDSLIAKFIDRRVPCVTIFNPILEIPAVVEDNSRAMEHVFAHLGSLGHRELGLTTRHVTTPHSELVRAWKLQCLRPEFHRASDRIVYLRTPLAERACEVVELLKGSWKEVTALVVADLYLTPYLLQELTRAKIRVPDDISIVSIGELPIFRSSTPPVSCLSFSIDAMLDAAMHLLERSIRKKEQTGNTLKRERLWVEPLWIDRASVGRPKTAAQSIQPAPTEIPWQGPPMLQLEDTPLRRHMQVAQILNNPYPSAYGKSLASFTQVDLMPFLNRPLNFRRGWLGDRPLLHLPPGEYRFHSVPFQICGGPAQSDCGAVVFRSLNNSKGRGKPLPDSIRIPINSLARAVYILHGCGWAKYLLNFATYSFHGQQGLIEAVPIVTLGQAPLGISCEDWETESKKANIQDWWSELPHIDFPTGRRVLILGNEQAPTRCYLYTLEWVNPTPDKVVEVLEVRVNPNVSATLGILGVSVLRPAG